MVHRGRRPRLPGEALAEHRIGGHRRSHDLQRHQQAQALIAGPVHHGHPARANLRFQPVTRYSRYRPGGGRPIGAVLRRVLSHLCLHPLLSYRYGLWSARRT